MIFLELLRKNWKLAFGASVLAAALLAVTILTHQRDSARDQLRAERNERQAERVRLEVAVANAKQETKDHATFIEDFRIPNLLAQAEKQAVANYKAKYGSRTAAGCSGPLRLPNVPTGITADSNQASSAEDVDATPSEFIHACAHDAAIVIGWQEWAKLNKLEVKE